MWQYSTETVIEDYIDIYEMSESVISALEPFSDRIKDAMRSMNLCGVLQVVLYLSMDDSLPTPAIGMSERTVNFVASVGASIDIDTYRIG